MRAVFVALAVGIVVSPLAGCAWPADGGGTQAEDVYVSEVGGWRLETRPGALRGAPYDEAAFVAMLTRDARVDDGAAVAPLGNWLVVDRVGGRIEGRVVLVPGDAAFLQVREGEQVVRLALPPFELAPAFGTLDVRRPWHPVPFPPGFRIGERDGRPVAVFSAPARDDTCGEDVSQVSDFASWKEGPTTVVAGAVLRWASIGCDILAEPQQPRVEVDAPTADGPVRFELVTRLVSLDAPLAPWERHVATWSPPASAQPG